MYKSLALAMVLATGSPTMAGELTAPKAEHVNLGTLQGVVFYTSGPDGYRVVATLADQETGSPVRFEVTLADAQKLVVSTPGKLGENGRVLEMSRQNGRLIVAQPHPQQDILVVDGPPNTSDE